MSRLNPFRQGLLAAAFASTMSSSTVAFAADSPGAEALEEFRTGRSEPKAIENRFFLKKKRFEFGVRVGYVPNNSFAQRYVLPGVILNYHLSETVAVGADVTYSPDFGKGDLKQLVGVLLNRANQNPDPENEFVQPLDKVTLAASFGLTWAPLYGKINLIGETVLNFDFYGTIGIGIVSIADYYGTYIENPPNPQAPNDYVALEPLGNEVRPAVTLGIGQNYFLNQFMALKIDARAALYLDNRPSYERGGVNPQQKVYNNLIASVGIAIFLPKMKPRLYDF